MDAGERCLIIREFFENFNLLYDFLVPDEV